MNKIGRSLAISAALLSTFFSIKSIAVEKDAPQSFNQKQMVQSIDFLTNIFYVTYAPFQWKQDSFSWNLEDESQKAKNAILAAPSLSNKDFTNIIKAFCQATHDYHVVPRFYSTAIATLPFNIRSAEGKYFVSHIYYGEIDSIEDFPLSVGDEIVKMNGKPIKDVVEEFRSVEIGTNYSGTDQALAEVYLTNRIGAYGHDIPKGSVSITSRSSSAVRLQSFSLDWNCYEEEITPPPKPHNIAASQLAKSVSRQKPGYLQKHAFLKKSFMTPHYETIRKLHAASEGASDMMGARQNKLPPLGTILWESKNHEEFYAYLFLTDDFRIVAYVRIPSYHVDSDEAAFEFAELIEFFEEVSDLLVIDQMSNGGGSVLYTYALLAMLTDKGLEVPKHRMMLTQVDIDQAVEEIGELESITNDRSARKVMGDTLEGLVVNYDLAQSFLRSAQSIVKQWNEGKQFTDYHALYGIDRIPPHPEVRYTKPIVVLVNSLDFSGADFFPAILQDNKRAKIIGTRTAGAGGYIELISFPNLNGIASIALTASFSQRPNGKPLENLGVTPDVVCELTTEDLQNEYVDFKEKILYEIGRCLN